MSNGKAEKKGGSQRSSEPFGDNVPDYRFLGGIDAEEIELRVVYKEKKPTSVPVIILIALIASILVSGFYYLINVDSGNFKSLVPEGAGYLIFLAVVYVIFWVNQMLRH